MNINPYSSPEAGGKPLQPKTRGWRPRLIELLAVVGVIGLLIAMLLPVRRGARGAARMSQCANNLKQISLALDYYESQHGELPPAYTVDADGKPLHSWRTLILPFMQQQALYDKIDLSKPWDDPANKEAFETSLSTYRCAAGAIPETHTTYLAVVAPNGCFQPARSRKLSEITDSRDGTLMVVEVAVEHAIHWMSPRDASEEDILNLGTAATPPHANGVQAVTVGGRVLFLSTDTQPAKLRAIISIAGSDDDIAGETD